ncbi:hypothetical protein WR25_14963 isoform B [Diploscapter pachys]|uniref:Uncharacterized protein n=1 Tax=Diploscapter pachys TaxID=2018661 RepID=A0A2A2LSL5_9BILA|nr:hypothetical protein WR25_14963 isoform B [Diploscapter pachys]
MATRKGGDGKRKGSKRSAQNGYRLNSPTSPYPVHIPCLHRHYSSTPLPSAPVNVSMHPSVHLVLLNSIVLCFASKAEYRARLKALANEVTDELNIIRHEAASDELARKYFPEVRNRFINHILFIYNAGDDAIRQKEKSFNQKQFKKHMLKLRKIRDDVLFGLKNEEITQEVS